MYIYIVNPVPHGKLSLQSEGKICFCFCAWLSHKKHLFMIDL